MNRMSARYIGIKLGISTEGIYEILKDIGYVFVDKFGDWALTDLGRANGGRMSKNNYRPVPTFDFDVIEGVIVEHLKR